MDWFCESFIGLVVFADLFRKNILERGGSAKPMDLYRAFRGGEPSIDALLERDGISK